MGTFNLDLLINRVLKTRKYLLRCRCFAQRLQKAQFFWPKIETENLFQKSLYYFFQLAHRKQHHRNHKTKNKHRKTVMTKIHLHHKLYRYSRIQHKNTANYTKTYLCTIHLIIYLWLSTSWRFGTTMFNTILRTVMFLDSTIFVQGSSMFTHITNNDLSNPFSN